MKQHSAECERARGYSPELGCICPAAIREPAAPVPGTAEIAPLVQADLQARIEMGIAHYGQPLMAHDGRDTLVDAYQEALDLALYLRKLLLEREGV